MNICDISDTALNDLAEIGAYIARYNLRASERLLSELQREVDYITEMPELYRERPMIAPGVRLCPYKKYVIIYRIVDSGIRIERIVHGARDIPGLFEII